MNRETSAKLNKRSIAIYGLLSISLVTNCVLTGFLSNCETSAKLKRETSSKTSGSISLNQSLNGESYTCPGKDISKNVRQYNLGQNIWAHMCYSEYIPAWILDIRCFFNGSASIKGIALQKNQWSILDQNREIIANNFHSLYQR